MTGQLIVHRVGPAVSVQDLGRPGHMVDGLSCGGAADQSAIVQGAALLGQDMHFAALEMAGFGGEFEPTQDLRITLTGAPMQASIDGQPVAWNASHLVAAGQRLAIGAAREGLYGYLHVGGGFASEPFLGSRATHLVAGIGALIGADDRLPVGEDKGLANVGFKLPGPDHFHGGELRILPSVQTSSFAENELHRLQNTKFMRSPRGNRQGVELTFEGDPFVADAQLTILSEPMIPGDIQMTGTGVPFILLPECQTTGGYPRIGTVVPDDLSKVAQAAPGTTFSFKFISHEDAVKTHRPLSKQYRDCKRAITPLLRDPGDIPDLLGYQLISGMVTGAEDA